MCMRMNTCTRVARSPGIVRGVVPCQVAPCQSARDPASPMSGNTLNGESSLKPIDDSWGSVARP